MQRLLGFQVHGVKGQGHAATSNLVNSIEPEPLKGFVYENLHKYMRLLTVAGRRND